MRVGRTLNCNIKIMIKFLDLKGITDKYACEIKEATNKVIDSGWYLQGNANKLFESNYAHYIGTKYVIFCDTITLRTARERHLVRARRESPL